MMITENGTKSAKITLENNEYWYATWPEFEPTNG